MGTQQTSFTHVQSFLVVAVERAFAHIRKPKDFTDAFPPDTVIACVYDHVELRSQLLNRVAQTHLALAKKVSRTSAVEQLTIALEESIGTPDDALAVLTPDVLVRYFPNPDLWAFIAAPADRGDQIVHDTPSNRFTCAVLEEALKLKLVTPEEIVRSIGFADFFKCASKPSIIEGFDAFASHSVSRQAFASLLEDHRFPPSVIVRHVAPKTLWSRVIDPLITARHHLIRRETESPRASSPAESDTKEEGREAEGDWDEPEPAAPIAQDAEPEAIEDSELDKLLSASEANPDVPSVSSSEARSEDLAPVTTDPVPDAQEARPSTAPPDQRATLGGIFDIDPSPLAPVKEPPRPRPSAHPSGDPDVTIQVSASPPDDPVLETGDRVSMPDVPYIPDDQFTAAGGTRRGEVPETTPEMSVTPHSAKIEVYDLLQKAGLKLDGAEPDKCGVKQMMITALVELEERTYKPIAGRLRSGRNEDAGNALCVELEKRDKDVADQLRRILGEIGCASRVGPLPRSSPSASSKPPGLRGFLPRMRPSERPK